MAVLPGFVGPSYVSTAKNASVETLENWYPQSLEVPTEPARVVYYPRPGLPIYATLSDAPVRALFEQDGRQFAVGGQTLFEVFYNAVPTNRGTLSAKDTNPATINSNGTAGHQLYITSGGQGDIFDLNTNVLTPITATGYPTSTAMGSYQDGYFLTTKGNSAQFNISSALDGTAWSTLDFAIRVAGSDNLVGIAQFNKIMWLIGSHSSEPWYDSGAASFPYQQVPQTLIQMGCVAPFTITRTSNALCWLHQSERGRGIFVEAADYSPKRVSTYAIEAIWQTYPTLTDAVAYGLTWQGHEFVVLSFPSGNATWVYDIDERLWSKWSWWNQKTGAQDRFRGWVHCDMTNGHLVGDWETGSIYVLDSRVSVDLDQPIVWERTSPHLNNQQQFHFYANFQLDMETGLGGSTPIARLDWSDDGGHTWSTPIDMSTGAIGEYQTRCRAAGNLGRSRDRVFRIRMSNDVPPRLTNAYCDIRQGTN